MQAIAEALLEGDCFNATVATFITAETQAIFEVVENCDRDDFSIGDAFASTDGSTAEGVRSSALSQCHCNSCGCFKSLPIPWLSHSRQQNGGCFVNLIGLCTAAVHCFSRSH